MNSIIVGICFLMCNFGAIIEQNKASMRYESLNMILPINELTTEKETNTFFKKKQFIF